MALAADVANLIVALRLDDKGFSGKLNKAAAQLNAMDKGLSQMGRGAGQVSQGVGKLATVAAAAAAGGLTAVVTTAASFEQAWTNVEKTVGGNLEGLEKDFREMARSIPVSFEELASIGAEGGALGIAKDDLLDFTDVVARLAVSTNLTSDQAATALGQLGNVLHLSGSEFREFGDTLVALGNAGASTEDQIIDMAARFGAAGNAAGLSKEEILALSSAVASMGVEVEAGGSSLSRLFNETTTNIATGSGKAKEFAKALGLTFEDFRNAWDKDALGTFQDLLSHLNKLDKFQAAALLKKIGITNIRDINAIGLMAQNVGFVGDQLEIAQSAQGALGKESGKFFETASAQWQILKNNVRDAASVIGTELLPVFVDLSKDIVEFLAKPETQKGLQNFATDLAGGLRDLIKEIKGADFGPLIDSFKGAAAIAQAGFNAFNALPSGVKAVALAALGVNKLTGGALGDIAKGFGNLFGGGLKLLIPQLNRGQSPVNPMFVKEVGVGGLGGKNGPVAAGGKGGGGLLGNVLKLLGVIAVAEVADQLDEPLGQLASDLHEGSFLKDTPLSGLSLNDMQWPFGPKNTPTILPDIFGGNGILGGEAAPSGPSRARAGSFADDDAASFDEKLTRDFGGKLDKLATNDVLEHLARTTEIGLKDVGTSFQTGIKTGLDPVGDIATKILARAEDPKAPPVMAEIKGHLSGLEEIQAQYLANGDINLANKVQTNIDTLHSLIGTVDQNRAVTQRLSDDARSSDAAMLSTARLQTTKLDVTSTHLSGIKSLNSSQLAKQSDALAAARGQSGLLSQIRDKKSSVNITVPVSVSMSTSVVQRQIQTLRTTIGGGGFI